ncbi:DUF6482 family protein [Vibrio breoganii]|uniref:Na(+)-translocating NADH-quinone reductase subunit B n=1 Tax=Vibrio breoganii TaxID=553239 RepID=A0AAP8MTA3_9VIBR|nr:DUF6482 family protein [Vibrio breoganii]NMO74223.1 hypothetical protein [Vibrio breoganii]NMR70962.1 hypothetical protein [Vibrio breoganii]OED87674.1 hypothetical protein A1QE_18270 [Vibrio breoganii ZF-55]PMG02993.1 hypothetical protein BCV02_10045 [Vibrio breoganii]PMG06841.1 hypothetical protein BCV08_04715 [Vibrio breoganii]
MELLIESLEGDIYLAYQVQGEHKVPLLDQYNNPRTFRSLEQVREHCTGETYQSASLLQATAYDEMCGFGESERNATVMNLNWF